jgi:molybdopterin-containing oxidoreductase family iron-sulfur binding subunit
MMTRKMTKTPLDLTTVRQRLAESQGRHYWRSLEELADTEEFQELLQREFPRQAAVWPESVSRRGFLQLMAASLALAGLSGCTRQPAEKIVPYVKPPEGLIPGKPQFYATAVSLGGIASGVLVESHMGRPTKVEGNPQHPASLGATDAFAQASVLTLYDPDRAQVVSHARRLSTWDAFLAAMKTALDAQRLKQGEGLRILTETVTSPTLAYQLQDLLQKFPAARWHQYEPISQDAVLAGARLAFGEEVATHYRLDKAEVILGLDADFLFAQAGSVRYTHDFTEKRRVRDEQSRMNRLYVVESTPSITGTMADHRLPLQASEIEHFVRAVAAELGVFGVRSSEFRISPTPNLQSPIPKKWIDALVRDLQQHRGISVVIAGDHQPPVVHALAHAMNHFLDNVGHTVVYTAPVQTNPVDQMESLRALTQDMEAGKVELLVILGGNPVFTAPADLGFAALMEKVPLRIQCSLYEDETAALCHWHVPETHPLETWSDARAYDGTVTILQPLIAPLYSGKSLHEVVAVLAGQANASSHDLVRQYWESQHPEADFEQFWREALHDGLIAGTAFPQKAASLKADWTTPNSELRDPKNPQSPTPPAESLEILFRPDPTIWDGRFANNGWLQELPKPLTKLTWDNAALLSPATAERLQVTNEEIIELRYRERTVRAPVWIMPGHADNGVTVHLGYGRTHAGQVGGGIGFNAYALRTADAPWFGSGLEIRKTGQYASLACTQHHHSMEGRNPARSSTLAEYREHPHFVHELGHDPAPDLTLYPQHEYTGYAWGMAIDLGACTGCNACVVACQAENNIPIVGKAQVAVGREMHWIRIDRYYGGNLENPETLHQPVLCMHCENAPCEPVCPVGATVHSSEGLNDMVYNRCVGTRYCSNNCPYKVRRFNFLLYADYVTPSLKALRNPDVTVRSRGVMEKCTYCVQRINAARITAEKEDRKIRDGEIVTACQAACPAQAIVFGDINDPNSRVSRLKAEPLSYGLLTELNTRPRTTYLARLRNPNPEIEHA